MIKKPKPCFLMHIWDYLIKGQEEKGTTEDKMVDGITDAMDMSLSTLQERVKDRAAWRAAAHGVAKSRTRLGNWTTTKGGERTKPARRPLYNHTPQGAGPRFQACCAAGADWRRERRAAPALGQLPRDASPTFSIPRKKKKKKASVCKHFSLLDISQCIHSVDVLVPSMC